jgi:uncharacterized protein YchJ
MYGKKYSFRNPLKQNFAHVKALQEKMSLPFEVFIPIVVFSINSEIKVKTSKPVVYTSQLKRARRYIEKKFMPNFEKVAQMVGITVKECVDPGSSHAARLLTEGQEQLVQMGMNVDLDTTATEISSLSFENGMNGRMTRITKKVYPNDPCPCGSGKKFKKCCGKL